jgi:hypothetical protein
MPDSPNIIDEFLLENTPRGPKEKRSPRKLNS